MEIPLDGMEVEKKSGKAGKNFKYLIVIPNVEMEPKKDLNDPKIPFWLRIFANQEIDVAELPETIALRKDGNWTTDSAGGKLRTKNRK